MRRRQRKKLLQNYRLMESYWRSHRKSSWFDESDFFCEVTFYYEELLKMRGKSARDCVRIKKKRIDDSANRLRSLGRRVSDFARRRLIFSARTYPGGRVDYAIRNPCRSCGGASLLGSLCQSCRDMAKRGTPMFAHVTDDLKSIDASRDREFKKITVFKGASQGYTDGGSLTMFSASEAPKHAPKQNVKRILVDEIDGETK